MARARIPWRRVNSSTVAPDLLILDNREAILSLAPLLEELAVRCGQAGAMHWLPYFLDKGVTRFRVPCLVLTLRPQAKVGATFRVDDLKAAALFFEYRFFGVRSGIVSTGDAVGFNSVVAPLGERARVAARSARALVQRGAVLVLSTYESAGEPEMQGMLAGWTGMLWGWRERQVGRILPLKATFEATLANLGKSTRFNLRYYRRRLIKELPCEYVADAAPLLHEADLRALNAHSLNPVDHEEFERRVRSASALRGSYLCGLRTQDGRWLSLIGGWRQNGTTVLYWQMNTLGFEKHSIGTVMRSFYLEHEIEQGAQRLLIYGGTSHTMRHAFVEEPVADLVVQRPGVRGMVLRTLARIVGSPRNRFGRQNFLANTLRSADLRWQVGSAPSSGADPSRIDSPRKREIA